MTQRLILLKVIFLILLLGCKGDNKNEGNTNSGNRGEVLLSKVLEAHGGLEKWKSYGGLEYELNNNGQVTNQLFDLYKRKAYIESENFKVGYNGNVAWSIPGPDSIPGQSAYFYHNLDFYFFAIPFVLADPGTIPAYDGKRTINGNTYECVKISYQSDVGFSPEDVYIICVDPETWRVNVLLYSVTYFNSERTKLNAKVYRDFKEIKGLTFATKMVSYEWTGEDIGDEKTGVRTFKNINLMEAPPPDSRFDPREEAVIEKQPG